VHQRKTHHRHAQHDGQRQQQALGGVDQQEIFFIAWRGGGAS
jgi:hypothetical protein